MPSSLKALLQRLLSNDNLQYGCAAQWEQLRLLDQDGGSGRPAGSVRFVTVAALKPRRARAANKIQQSTLGWKQFPRAVCEPRVEAADRAGLCSPRPMHKPRFTFETEDRRL
jgi:hypothetical protein